MTDNQRWEIKNLVLDCDHLSHLIEREELEKEELQRKLEHHQSTVHKQSKSMFG